MGSVLVTHNDQRHRRACTYQGSWTSGMWVIPISRKCYKMGRKNLNIECTAYVSVLGIFYSMGTPFGQAKVRNDIMLLT